MKNFTIGILGATGAVGQKFIRLLQDHPWFTIAKLGASERSAGKPYKAAVHWIESTELPQDVADIQVTTCGPEHFNDVDFVFSGLDSSVAGTIERNFAEAGIPVISNAKNFRMEEAVPLLIPEINPEHIALIESQTFTEDSSGWIVTNPNCVCVPLAMSLRPFYDAFGIESVIVTSMQATPALPALIFLATWCRTLVVKRIKFTPNRSKFWELLNIQPSPQLILRCRPQPCAFPPLRGICFRFR